MTIKELCNNQEDCKKCPFGDLCALTLNCRNCEFYGACPYTNEELWGRQFYDLDEETDNRFTKAIIKTARRLEGKYDD